MTKTKLIIILISLASTNCGNNISESDIEFTNYPGPYIGQELPGNISQSFIPEIFHDTHSCPVFSQDGKEVYWTAHEEIHFMEEINGAWTTPRHIKLIRSSDVEDVPFLSNDGNRLFFTAIWINSPSRNGIYYIDRIDGEWSEAVSVGNNINNTLGHWQFSVSENGSIYYPGIEDNFHINVSKLENNTYQQPTVLFPSIEARFPFIDLDERFILFASSYEQPSQPYYFRLYICYKQEDGSWGDIYNLSELLGISDRNTICPIVSPDGNYLFFMDGGCHWIRFDQTQISNLIRNNS